MADNLEKPVTFRWTATRHRAAVLVAADDLSNAEIAAQLGIAASTLSSWKARPEFMAVVGDHIGQLQAGMLRYRIAKKRERIKILDHLHTKLLTVMEERAADWSDQAQSGKDVPAGAGTGLILRQYKQLGTGQFAQIIEEFGIDTGLIREIRALEQQAAQELGQWVEKTEEIGAGLTTVVQIVGVNAELI